MQTPPPTLRSGPIFMIDADTAESNGKSIFQVLFFESWLIVFTILRDTLGFPSVSPTEKNRSKVVKFTAEMQNALKRMKNQYTDFKFLNYGRFLF